MPAFGTPDRLARRVRLPVNRRFWETILSRLTTADFGRLDELLPPDKKVFRTPYNSLKNLPKNPTLKNLQQMLDHLEWLLGLGDFETTLKDIPPSKIKHFAAEAKALDVGEIKDFNEPKRYALPICLIDRAHVKARDALAQMFIRRIAEPHHKGKERTSCKKFGSNIWRKANDW